MEQYFESVFFGALVAIAIGVSVYIASLLHNGLARIPQSNRSVEPYFAWLTAVPFVGLIFFWILLPYKIPESLNSYFTENPNDADCIPDDFGKFWGMGTAITATLMLIPVVNFIVFLPALGFLIFFLKQFNKMVALIPQPDFIAVTAGSVKAPIKNQADRFEQLVKLKKLLDDGVLTENEFSVEKRKIL